MALRKINFLSCSKLIFFCPETFFVPFAIVFKFYFSHEWNKFLHVRTVLSIPPINSRINCPFEWQKSARTRIYLISKARLEPHRTERQVNPERLGYLFVKRLFDLCHDALRIKLFGTRIKHNCFLFCFGAADRSIFSVTSMNLTLVKREHRIPLREENFRNRTWSGFAHMGERRFPRVTDQNKTLKLAQLELVSREREVTAGVVRRECGGNPGGWSSRTFSIMKPSTDCRKPEHTFISTLTQH